MQLEVKINLILHATEDENKVLEKLEENLGIEQKDFQIEQIPGHFNNPILLISSQMKKKPAHNFISLFFSWIETAIIKNSEIKKVEKTKFDILYDYDNLLNSVSHNRYIRVYAKYNKVNGKYWFENINKTITDRCLRKIIPVDKKNGLIQLCYCDSEYAEMLNNENINMYCYDINPELCVPKGLNLKDMNKCEIIFVSVHIYYCSMLKRVFRREYDIMKVAEDDGEIPEVRFVHSVNAWLRADRELYCA